MAKGIWISLGVLDMDAGLFAYNWEGWLIANFKANIRLQGLMVCLRSIGVLCLGLVAGSFGSENTRLLFILISLFFLTRVVSLKVMFEICIIIFKGML